MTSHEISVLRDRLVSLAERLQVRNPEDVVQDVFLKIGHRLPSVHPKARFAYAKQALLWEIGKQFTKVREVFHQSMKQTNDDTYPDTSTSIADVDALLDFRRGLSRLPTNHRRALQLQFEGLTQRMIANELGISVATLRNWFAQIRCLLTNDGTVEPMARPT